MGTAQGRKEGRVGVNGQPHMTAARTRAALSKARPSDQIVQALVYARRKHPAFCRGHLHALVVLLEEVFEVVWALLRRDWPNLREELAHVAAVCWRWLEMIETKAKKSK